MVATDRQVAFKARLLIAKTLAASIFFRKVSYS